MSTKNDKIRRYAQNNKVKLWEVSDKLGITDTSLSKKLRYELPEQETNRIISIIDKIVLEREMEVTEDE